MTKVKLKKNVADNCLKDSENDHSYCLIPIIVDKRLINDDVFNKIADEFPNIFHTLERFYTIPNIKIPLDIEIFVKDVETQAGTMYEIIPWIPYQVPLLHQIPCFVSKHLWEIVEV